MLIALKRATSMLPFLLSLLLLWSWTASAQLLPVGPLTVSTAVAGSQPAPVIGNSSYSAVLVFAGQMRVVASLNANMPPNTTLGCRVSAPSGGTSLGVVNLDITARNVVIAATPVFFTNVSIQYTFTPTVAAGVIPLTSRTVTFTLLVYP